MLLTIVPLAAVQLVTMLAVMSTVENDIKTRAHESLVVGGTVVAEHLASRGEQLRTSVEVLSADFGLKEATATGDAETIRSVLENHSRRVHADMALLADLDGNAVSSTLGQSDIQSVDLANLLADVDTRGLESTAVFDNIAYHVFIVPLRAPVTVGWVILGFRIDDQITARIADLTGLDVSIMSEQGEKTSLIASTSPALNGTTETLTRRVQFVAGSSAVVVILQRSMQEAMLPYVEARRGLAVFGIVLLLLAASAAVFLAKTIAEPLRTLARSAQRMISGDYDDEVPLRSRDEFGELASSFNAMRTAIAEREQRITHQASHNSLTDLPNRYRVLQFLTSAIENARGSEQPVSVLSIRISGMGEIASTLGHKASDQLIKVAAQQLHAKMAEGDLIGHTESEEFILVLTGQDTESALSYVEKIERVLATGVLLDDLDVALQADIGIAEFPRHGDVAADLMRFALIARTDVARGKERVRVYQEGREEEFVRSVRVVHDLRTAIRRRELDVWLQPKISLPDGKVYGAEALVRWHHPEFGFLPPDDFIPAAEKSGSIVHLSRYVLAEAVQSCKRLEDIGHDLHMSVNLSVRDLLDEYLPYHVLQILKEHDVDPGKLTLEVTESSIMEDVGHAVLVLECLRDIGVKISMDDFGTGHSSLAQLRNIPLHELKIDKTFVMSMATNTKDESIVRTTIGLARDLDLAVVAEGVEDETTLRRIAELGCQQAQGYFLSKPVPFDDFIRWLDVFEPRSYTNRRGSHRAFSA